MCVPLEDYNLKFQATDLKALPCNVFGRKNNVEKEVILDSRQVFKETVKCVVVSVESQSHQVEKAECR